MNVNICYPPPSPLLNPLNSAKRIIYRVKTYNSNAFFDISGVLEAFTVTVLSPLFVFFGP